MASSGAKTFNLPIDEVVEEAFELAGLESYTGNDLRMARRVLNLLLTDWSNRGVNLWTLYLATIAMTTGQAQYTLATTVIDMLDAVLRDASASDNLDTEIERVSIHEYLTYPAKEDPGQPVSYAIQRNADSGHTMFVWPTPNATSLSILGWQIRHMDEITATGGEQHANIPIRFLPALVYGLAYFVFMKRSPNLTEMDVIKRNELKQLYEEALSRAMDEDRERSDWYIQPWSSW